MLQDDDENWFTYAKRLTSDESGFVDIRDRSALKQLLDKLNELSQLVSKLRFACETSNQDTMIESEKDILLLSRYLPERYDLNRVVEVLKQNDAKSAKLAELYIQRCFHLAQEEYSEVAKLEDIIKDLE